MYLLRKSGKCVHFPAERINAFPTMLYDRLLDKPEFIELFSLVVIASPEGAWQSVLIAPGSKFIRLPGDTDSHVASLLGMTDAEDG